MTPSPGPAERATPDSPTTLTASGPPPYADILDYEPALTNEHEVYPYDHSGNAEGAGGFSENLFVEEYTLMEQVHNLGAFLDVFTVLSLFTLICQATSRLVHEVLPGCSPEFATPGRRAPSPSQRGRAWRDGAWGWLTSRRSWSPGTPARA